MLGCSFARGLKPDLVGGNISAPVMIAEKAADLIRGREALPAAP
jgi:hypothetical protein